MTCGPKCESWWRKSTQDEAKKRQFTAEQRAVYDDMIDRMMGTMQAELSWQRMKPFYVKLYRDTFTQEEVNGILAIYGTPVGQAMLAKMPLLMQNMQQKISKAAAEAAEAARSRRAAEQGKT